MSGHSGGFALLMTLVFGIVLQIYPLSEDLSWWRPAWLQMVIIYWAMALPTRFGIGSAWLLGLVLDVSMGTTLGIHGASFAITAYLIVSLHNRLRLFTRWQQSLLVGLLVGLDLVLGLWIENFIDYRNRPSAYWLPMLTSTLIWPIAYILLRHIRRSFHIR